MGLFQFKLPDVGEGVTEAEIVEWHVKPGQRVSEDENLVDVMTDKATVEIPSPVTGVVKDVTGAPGDVLPIGTVVVTIETDAAGSDADVSTLRQAQGEDQKPEVRSQKPEGEKLDSKAGGQKSEDRKNPRAEPVEGRPEPQSPKPPPPTRPGAGPSDTKPLASPAVRKRALEQNVDLAAVPGSGPAGRITHQDLDDFIAAGGRLTSRAAPAGRGKRTSVSEHKIIGLRRKIAQNLAASKRTIPHFAYVEEVDMQALEDLRAHLNASRKEDQPKLTLLPFLTLALVRALPEFPQANAHYDLEAGVATYYDGVHMGIATATPNGLMVPVVHHAEALDVWQLASEIARVTQAAREGKASRNELSGSTITITSLGALGGIASTPVINAPEVAIIGVNKLQVRPVWQDGAFIPRKMMNLSSSFDHRIVDGYDAARLIQRVKTLLEHPATLFME